MEPDIFGSGNKYKTRLSRFGAILLSIAFVIGFIVLSMALPALATIYQPGETLEPDCAPGSVNCEVTVFNFNSQDYKI